MKIENDRNLSFKKLQTIGSRNDGWYEIALVKTLHFFMSSRGDRIHRVREARIHMRNWEYSHTSVSLYCGNNGFPGPKGQFIESPDGSIPLCPYCEIKAVALGLPMTSEIAGKEIPLANIVPRKIVTNKKPAIKTPMCKTAIIMTEAEAMALPQSKRPLCFRIPSAIYTAVFEAVGAASMCWSPRPGSEVFATEEASNVAVNLCFKIADELERLGITTEMMREVKALPQFRCQTCQEAGTIHIKEIGMRFCKSCLSKIDERIMAMNSTQPPPPSEGQQVKTIHEATCPKCGNYYPGHATGGNDICDCHASEPKTVATEPPSSAILQAECRHEYQEGSTVCRLCGS